MYRTIRPTESIDRRHMSTLVAPSKDCVPPQFDRQRALIAGTCRRLLRLAKPIWLSSHDLVVAPRLGCRSYNPSLTWFLSLVTIAASLLTILKTPLFPTGFRARFSSFLSLFHMKHGFFQAQRLIKQLAFVSRRTLRLLQLFVTTIYSFRSCAHDDAGE